MANEKFVVLDYSFGWILAGGDMRTYSCMPEILKLTGMLSLSGKIVGARE